MERNFEIDGYGPNDDRDEEDPEWTVDPEFSCTNTDFGGEDPAAGEPLPEEMAPAWGDEK
jgi:hypothetical protein